MSVEAARKLWTISAVAVFVLTFNLFAASQNWETVIEIPVVVFIKWDQAQPLIASLYGVFLVPVGLIVVAKVGLEHTRYSSIAGASLWSKIPIRITGIDPDHRVGRNIGKIALILCFFFPWYAVAHFCQKILNGGYVCFVLGDPPDSTIGLWSLDWRGQFIFNHSFRFGSESDACMGVTFQPFLEPLLAALIIVYAAASGFRFVYSLFRNEGPSG